MGDARGGLFLPGEAMSSYAKVHLSYPEQVTLLQRRGMHVADPKIAADVLARHGYYRLAGYWVPFQAPGQQSFLPGVTFDQVLALYEYDKRLRFLVLDALERIEIACRVAIAHFLGQLDSFALENPSLLDRRFLTGGYAKWLLRYHESIRKSTDKFIHDFREQYGLPLPVWLGVELWDFGMLSVFFSGMKFKHRDAIARDFGLGDGRIMKSWLHSLTVTRNICAHHGRFWNRTLSRPLALPDVSVAPRLDHLRSLSSVNSRRQYTTLAAIAHLLERVEPDSTWKSRVLHHIDRLPLSEHVHPGDMGFPLNWRAEQLWHVENEPPR